MLTSKERFDPDKIVPNIYGAILVFADSDSGINSPHLVQKPLGKSNRLLWESTETGANVEITRRRLWGDNRLSRRILWPP